MEYLFLIICLIMFLFALGCIAFLTWTIVQPKLSKKEIDIDEELDRAVETIEEYCLTQKDDGHCRFNLNDSNKECDCMLLRKPPEGWNHADDNKE